MGGVDLHASRHPWWIALAASLLLGACGGGLSIGVGIGDDDDLGPPSVSIAAAQDSVVAGQQVKLVAAAADENGIDAVIFYRVEGNIDVQLKVDSNPPYETLATAPNDGRTRLLVYARAIDGVGREAVSELLSIDVTAP